MASKRLIGLVTAVAVGAGGAMFAPIHAGSAQATTLIDVKSDVSEKRYARGSNRYRDQIRHYLHQARRGDAYALRQLGFYYQKGWGVFRDNKKAYMWFSLAEAKGNSEARANRDTVAGSLTPGERDEAEAMARRWAQNYKWDLEIGTSQ